DTSSYFGADPAIAIEKTAVAINDDENDTIVSADGDVVTYEITVTNSGNVPLSGIVVTDQVFNHDEITLDVGGILTPGDPTDDATLVGDDGTPGVLDVGETWTYTYNYTVTQDDIDTIGNLEWRTNFDAEDPYLYVQTVDEAVFIQGSDYPATGSGVIDSFVRIQAKGSEQGYNTDYRPEQFDEGNTAIFNHSISVADVPVITYCDDQYWEFRLDLNELDNVNNRDLITLTELQLYFYGGTSTSSNLLTDYKPAAILTGPFTDPGGDLTLDAESGGFDDIVGVGQLLFNLYGSVELLEWTSGSGHGDYTVLIPFDETVGEDGYLYLFSAFNGTDGGFEEWYVRQFGLLTNEADVTGSYTDDAGHTEEVSANDETGVTVAAAADYDLVCLSTLGSTANPLESLASTTSQLTSSVDNVIPFTVTIHNTGNVTLSNVVVTDHVEGGSPIVLDNSTVSGDDGNGVIDIGETWTYSYTHRFGEDSFDLNGDAKLTTVVSVDSDATHVQTTTLVVDVSSMIFLGVDAQSANWWATHLAAWDGNLSTNAWESLVGSDLSMQDVLIAVDSNRNGSITSSDAKGIMIGDGNGNGLTDTGETTLFVPLAAAQQLIKASGTATDARQVLMKEALTAQLNINNMSGDSTSTTTPEGPDNIVSEAAMWLRGLGPYTYGSNSTGNVDTNGDGSLSVGSNNTFEYRTSTNAFTKDANGSASGTNLSSTLDAWQWNVDVDGTDANVQAGGLDLKNGLKAFNDAHLVVSADGAYVGWDGGDSQSNTSDAFWSVLQDHAIL
ncbi:MAG TPA: hypothetical protein VJB15_06650, partial [Rhodothermia bacterium]|nr:hypothetical protein [Rhodothermia bacterium]